MQILLQGGDGGSWALEQLGEGSSSDPCTKNRVRVFPSDAKLRGNGHKDVPKVGSTKKKQTNYTF